MDRNSKADGKPDPVEEAMAMLGKWPLPANAEKQLDALYKLASAEDRRCCFPNLYSALFLLQNGSEQ